MKVANLIENNIVYGLFLFLIVILGFIVSLYVKLDAYLYLILIAINLFCPFILEGIFNKFFKNRSIEFIKKYIKVYNIFSSFAVFLTPIIFSMFYNSKIKLPLDITTFYLNILIIYSCSICYNDNILNRIRKEYKNSHERFITVVIIPFALMLIKHFNFTSFTKILVIQFSNYISISISFVVFCATLSLLAFTYCMVLNQKDDNEYTKFKEMRKNGVYLFKSTIFSIIFLFLLYSISYLQTFTFSIIDSIFSIDFAYAIFNSFLIILLAFFGSLTVYYLLIGIYLALKALGFENKRYELY